MQNMWSQLAILVVVYYYVTRFVFDIILRGFAPFIQSRPWVVKQLLNEMAKYEINRYPKFRVLAYSSGRSGFLHELEKRYPHAELVGYEKHIYPYLVGKLQSLIRRTKIKVKRSRHFHRIDTSDYDVIYSHVDNVNTIRELGQIFKFDCKPGTLVLSVGFNIPNLEASKAIEQYSGQGRLAFLSKNRRFFRKKVIESQREKKVYYFQI